MRLVEAARGYLDVKWRHMGRSRFGIDCVGLVLLAARDLGHLVEDVPEYVRGAHGYDVVREIAARTRPASLGALREDLIILFRESIYPCHCGILGAGPHGWTLVHAHAKSGKVVEDPYDFWAELATHAFALPDREG
ncbi:NlpC/P60 family protein [Inquilinus limosus]|uniref:NlpC/P60 domain-containing protein n=1 Tax=Inquilinus limosus MP06 TaxID=1398085 RepID=A0A0A0D7V9_9PROT|nr:C40 family peptidase [Inquilinus limosus]KGM34771.1 hypothetical protein P409_08385 [Inquilinus limosus MP06]